MKTQTKQKSRIRNGFERAGLAGLLGFAGPFLQGCETTPAGQAAFETLFFQASGAAVSGALDPKGNTIYINDQNKQDYVVAKNWNSGEETSAIEGRISGYNPEGVFIVSNGTEYYVPNTKIVKVIDN